MATFVVEMTFGDQEKRAAVRPAHRDHLTGLVERGVIVMSGPWADDRGALLVFEVADADEVRALVAADPYSLGGVLADVTIREWTPILRRVPGR